MPWLEMLALSAAFLLGTFYADVWNRNSVLSQWWADYCRVFDVSVHPRSQSNHQVSELTVDLKCIKRATGIGIEILAHKNFQFELVRPLELVGKIPHADYSPGEVKKVRVARISIAKLESYPGSYWTDRDERIVPNSDNVIFIRAVKRRRFFPVVQEFRLLLSLTGTREETGKGQFFYFEESRRAF